MQLVILSLAILSFLLAVEKSTCEWPVFYYYPHINSTPAPLNSSGLLGPTFPRTKQTVFVVHGWKASIQVLPMIDIRDSLLKNTPENNVIMVDWSEGGSNTSNYMRAVLNTQVNGRAVFEFIRANYLNPSLVYCVGHSLGAHSCGFTGKWLLGTMSRITGLDPAGPGFTIINNRLVPTDAQFVDIIHTSRFLGTILPSGDLDFYPNFSRFYPGNQPNCSDTDCNHVSACTYFAASTLKSCALSATFCSRPRMVFGFFIGCLQTNPSISSLMGYHASKTSAPQGTYMVNTNSYCKC